jgi:ABC-type proline/glycine betaine transport system permease subunit
MHRALTLVVRALLVIAVTGVVRAILSDRSPRRALRGSEPVVGSLDTWPTVPRRPPG